MTDNPDLPSRLAAASEGSRALDAGRRTIFRVQDKSGRGPFRPGMSKYWADRTGSVLPPYHHEFGLGIIEELYSIMDKQGGAIGCAVSTLRDICNWFSPREIDRLSKMGFTAVSLEADMIVRESRNQILFWRRMPLYLGVQVLAWPCSSLRARATKEASTTPPDQPRPLGDEGVQGG